MSLGNQQDQTRPNVMPDLRIVALSAITAIALIGTTYSVIYDSYLDTSNPLISSLPHPLHKTHYFASKSNILNVYFVKFAWSWNSAALIALWTTAKDAIKTKDRIGKWAIATAVFFLFTVWFFGPAIMERVILASGGDCIVGLPSGTFLVVPNEYCLTKSTISPSTHPALFSSLLASQEVANPEWRTRPRLMRGHDVSGHMFLLTMSVLILVDQLRSSFRDKRESWSVAHRLAVGFNLAVILAWLFGIATTSVYFHSPLEKLTGYRK